MIVLCVWNNHMFNFLRNIKRLKRSFTLVELSIVLLVLSILVGVLLTGRKIVDRANLQRVIFELDYYKKALYLYRDTYNVYPGNMDEETCMKYSEFSLHNLSDVSSDDVGQFCRNDRTQYPKGKVDNGFVNSSVMSTNESWVSFLNGMRFLKTSGIINEVETTIADDEFVNGNFSKSSDDSSVYGPSNQICKNCISYETVKRTQGKLSFDNNGVITIAGITINENENAKKLSFIRGSNNIDGKGHELDDNNFLNLVNGKNVLILYRNTPSNADDNGNGLISTGIFSADMTNQLDVKLDDGKPGSGKILALKNGYSRATNVESKTVCYNQTQDNISKAYYLNNKENENGCNIIYVLE